MPKHNTLNDELNSLKAEIANSVAHVQKMINSAIVGLLERDETLLNKVLNEDESFANNKELEIENQCVELIAQYSPKATSLRTALMIIKMNNDLERMADHCANIARISLALIKQPALKPLSDIQSMKDSVQDMLKNCLKAFLDENVTLAEKVCKDDQIVDDLKDSIFRDLVALMSRDGNTVERASNIINISRNLERIADLTTNLAENTIFIIRGKVIKHNAQN
jgi:phosphate transport system protein